MTHTQRLCMLMILDGWGINKSRKGNAVALAQTPFLDSLFETYPHAELLCSGEAVGLPAGIMGNSEVGHLNLGAGRIVYQELLRIDRAIRDRSFFENKVFESVISKVKAHHSALHLMGLVSDGGVHSQLTHLLALLELAKREGLDRVYVHVILDGRDTPPDSGVRYVRKLQDYMDSNKVGVIATICGRFYAMDRDTRWERTQRAYLLYTTGAGIEEDDPVKAVENAYARGETDEFVKPILLGGKNGLPQGIVKDDDGMIFFNFRADRARQITNAFTNPEFPHFKRDPSPKLCEYACMTIYDEHFTLPIAFPPVHLKKILGEFLSDKGLKQLRIAETEKYAHVTYFFNGGEEKAFLNEERCLIPSPREVATYDQKPEMSAHEVAKKVIDCTTTTKYDVVVLNFANMDMVGHTGILDAAIKAVEAVDRCVRDVVTHVKSLGGAVIVTADHGNAEEMTDEKGAPHTAHTLNPVPVILVDDTKRGVKLRSGSLADIAPTLLELLGLGQPEEMLGKSLIII